MNSEHKLEEQTFKLVSWPSPQDYQEAIQAPLLNVDDQELKAGQVELNALGLPRPRTGFFATVYKMQCRSTDWAVRCFLNNIHDQKLRYAELSKFVMSDKLESTVRFHYVEQGIKVGGTWYPILKMEWVEGVTFGEYIEDRVRDFMAMRQLAIKFEEMMLTLQEAGVAHGDLQHGNIIVSRPPDIQNIAAADIKNSISLRLVDYDGMFVPQLSGWQSNEIGHRNYQHPMRNATHFGATLDNFSAWVIYCSLICLAVDPTLWDELEGGDECLLFRLEDFRDIKNSRAFSIMLYHPSPVVRECADWIAKILEMPPDKVPFLSASSSRAQALSFKQRVRRAVDSRKVSAKSSMKKTTSAGAQLDQAQAQAESPKSAPSHGYPQIISPKGSKGRLALVGFLVSVVLMYTFSVFGQALFNRQNSTMFPKTHSSGGVAAKNKLELPKVFFESEEGHMSTWTYSPVVDESNEPLKRNARRYEVAWDNGATSEVYVQAPKSGQVTATRKDLTGSTRGMQVRYEGGWNGEVFSGVANYVYLGENIKTVTFKAYPKKSESNWLKRTNDGQVEDEFKR